MKIPKAHIVKNHFGSLARIWGSITSARTGTMENSLISFAKNPYKYSSKKDYYRQFCRMQSLEFVEMLCRPSACETVRTKDPEQVFIGKSEKMTIQELVENHDRKMELHQFVPKLLNILQDYDIHESNLTNQLVIRFPGGQAVQDETNIGKEIRCHAVDKFHDHPRYSNVQITGDKGKWFAELLVIFLLPNLLPSVPLVYVRNFDWEGKASCPVYKLPLLKKSNNYSVILFDAIDQLVDLVPDSLDATSYYCKT